MPAVRESATSLLLVGTIVIFRKLQHVCTFGKRSGDLAQKTYLEILIAILMSGLDDCSLPSILIPAVWKRREDIWSIEFVYATAT